MLDSVETSRLVPALSACPDHFEKTPWINFSNCLSCGCWHVPAVVCGTASSSWADQSNACAAGKPGQYKEFYRELTHRTAFLVAMWQSVGFVHGVLNTDNMSILGEVGL